MLTGPRYNFLDFLTLQIRQKYKIKFRIADHRSTFRIIGKRCLHLHHKRHRKAEIVVGIDVRRLS